MKLVSKESSKFLLKECINLKFYLCTCLYLTLNICYRQIKSDKDSQFIGEEINQSMDVDKEDDSDEAKNGEKTIGPKQSKSQKKKNKNKKQGKQLIKSMSDADILGFRFDNTGDWTTKENKR